MSRQERILPFDQFSVEEYPVKSNTRRTTAWRHQDAHVQLRDSNGDADVSDRLFDRLDARLDARIGKAAGAMAHMDMVLLHGKNLGLAPIFDRIGDEFRSLEVYRSKALAFRAASQRVGHKTVFAIDLDSLGHIDKALPKLMHLRKINPLLSVLLLSAHFKRDDFSDEREAIADASIRLPSNASGIMRGIGYAVNNTRKRQGL
ncbi:hypothetical protein [Puniceibacterium confluentis]|uniref:hypothetical protein n=1 Tax=Puniceibacterium confluentis TaxID=1958944 RepID=UPI0011B63863|nr:hypothetical protein [Puniceibacterium confluentis]